MRRRRRRPLPEQFCERSIIVAPIQRFALIALALMASLPFLMPTHTSPIPTFHAEWLAALLGLVAAVALIGARSLPLPGATLLALAVAGAAMAQAAIGRAPIPQLTAMFGLYLLWAALLASTGSHLASMLGRACLTRALATAMLSGALLAALLSLLQPWLWPLGWHGFPIQQGGPIGQRNHLSIYLWFGLASALYLRTAARLSVVAFWAAALLLTLTAVLAGQRSSFLYALALIAVAAWQGRRTGGTKQPNGRRQAVGIGLMFVLLQPLVVLLPPLGGDAAKPPPALRAVEGLGGPSLRMQLMRVGVSGVIAAPLLGNGIGSYPGLALAHADDLSVADNPGPAEHAHNLFVDLAAELGLPIALTVALAAGIWLRRLPQRAAPAEAAWAAAMMVMLGLHSMIEYPLWHTFFLGPLALVAGAFGSDRRSGGRLAPAALALGLLAWGSLTLVDLRRDYAQLELAISLGGQPATVPRAKAALLRVPPASLLAPWVGTTACVSLDPLRVAVADGLAVCRVAITFAPCLVCGTNMAALLWRAGDATEARDLLRRLKRASAHNPGELDAALAPLASRAASLGALIESGR